VLASLSGSITSFVGDHGLYAVFVLMAIDAVFPAASELVMVYAGALASGAFAGQHVVLFGNDVTTPFWAYLAVVLAGTLGYLFGSEVGWAIGWKGGRPLAERRGGWLHLGPQRLARAEAWFDRWDDWAVALGRIVPVVRSFISVPAGIFRMPVGRYTVLTIPGSALWCFVFAGIGWALGASYESFHHAFDFVDVVIVAGAVALVLYLVARRRSN
jgi:membrane protein DedA with SNARE-associated domain